jgi:hypothetical protein
MSEPFGLWFGSSHLGFGTHVPILAAVVLGARPGPVVEFGMGLYSSPLLHMLCIEMDRELLSLDHDALWVERFGEMRELGVPGKHRLMAFPTWEGVEEVLKRGVGEEPWAVAFIDHGPDERRVVDCRRLANEAEFVVVHDWDWSESQKEIAKLFRFCWVSKSGPRTAVLSNVREFQMPGQGKTSAPRLAALEEALKYAVTELVEIGHGHLKTDAMAEKAVAASWRLSLMTSRP